MDQLQSFTIRVSSAFVVVVLFFLMTGCEGDQITNNIQNPEAKVDATLSGRVILKSSGDHVSGATCELLGTDMKTTSDERGIFNLHGLRVGTYSLIVSAPGCASTAVPISVRIDQFVAGTAKIHLTVDVVLAEKTAGLKLLILNPADGYPATGAEVQIAYGSVVYGQYVEDSDLPASYFADDEGIVEVDGLAAVNIDVVVQPYDANGDGVPDYGTTYEDIVLKAGAIVQKSIVLDDYPSTVYVIATNIPDYYSSDIHDPTVFLVFSTTMNTNPADTYISLTDNDYPYNPVPVNAVWISATRLEISPTVDLLVREHRYTFRVDASSTGGIDFSDSWSCRFDIGGPGPGGNDCSEVVTDLAVSRADNPLGLADYDTRQFLLSWSAVPCARGYRILAKDDLHNPYYQYVADEPTDYEWGTISTVVMLPESFDRYSSDVLVTPLAGTEVTFAVVPFNAEDPDPATGHGTASITDQTKPVLLPVHQNGSAWNTGNQTNELTIVVPFSEFISRFVADPVVTIEERGGDPNFVLNPSDGRWEWDAGRHSGRFMIPIQPNINGSGDDIYFTFTGLSDLANNTWSTMTVSEGLKLAISYFFGFENSPQGWSSDGVPDCWEWGEPTRWLDSGYNSVNCWGTDLDNYYGSYLNSRLTSPMITVPVENPRLTFYVRYDLGSGDRCRILIRNGGVETLLEEISGYGTLNSWGLKSYSLAVYAGQSAQFIFQFTSDYASGDYGVYIDNVEIKTVR